MSPNPYRTALLALGLLCAGFGILLILFGISDADVTTSFNLGAIGGFLLSVGATLFTLWLVASAIIYGLTVSPKIVPGSTFGSWLGLSNTQQPAAQQSYLDADGL